MFHIGAALFIIASFVFSSSVGIYYFNKKKGIKLFQISEFTTKLFFTDNVLVASAYYIGSEKKYDGDFPYIIIMGITTICMVSSEIVAKTRKRKIEPSSSKPVNANQSKNMVISNLIPFTRLNLIFAFSGIISAVIRIIQRTQIGVPKLSIQIVVMLICLLLSNSEAKKHFMRKCSSMRGLDPEVYHHHSSDPEANHASQEELGEPSKSKRKTGEERSTLNISVSLNTNLQNKDPQLPTIKTPLHNNFLAGSFPSISTFSNDNSQTVTDPKHVSLNMRSPEQEISETCQLPNMPSL